MSNIYDLPSNNNLTYGRGYVYSLQYHIVWCTKYRRKVLTDGIDDDIKTYLQSMANDYKFTITAMEIMSDYVHMLVDCSPQFEIPRMLKILKGNTARWMFLSHPEIKTKLWGGHLWNPSYCVVTVSDRSREQIINYINSQKER